jgi:diadenosine tetraphosphate (Ap4A) HIT family hydrolase
MQVHQDLSAIWRHIVSSGQIRNEFIGASGHRIESGLRMSAHGPEHYAVDVESGTEILVGVSERLLEGSDFILQLNPYRSLKPKPETLGLGRQADSSGDVKDCFFACQQPANPLSLLRRDIHIQTRFANYQWVALHNALPIERNGHFLWVPVNTHGAILAFPHWVQVLTLPLLEDFLQLAASSTDAMMFYNSMHAGGSVNHIHYHSVCRERAMPIESAATASRGGHVFLSDYPACGLVYPAGTPAEHIWVHVEKLQERAIPINLIHSGQRTFLFARDIEHEVVAEFPKGILAGMELAGRPITTDESFYQHASWAMLQTALRKSTLPEEELLEILNT